MWTEPTEEDLKAMPGLYQTEHIPLKEKLIQMHFFMCGCDWYMIEFDGEDLFFGFAILNGDLEMAEWGYISFVELKSLKPNGWRSILTCTGKSGPQKRSRRYGRRCDGTLQSARKRNSLMN